MSIDIMKSTKEVSLQKLDEFRQKLAQSFLIQDEKYKEICVYACGSMGRLEMTQNSDLDLFFVSMHTCEEDIMRKNLNRYLFFAKLYEINKEMGFTDPSKNGEYWDFINMNDLLDIGSRKEDFNNSFTARLLLILESKPVYNQEAYDHLVKETVMRYFVDYKDHQSNFYPLFMMNDILRYWYTLTLNYEYRRDNEDDVNKKNWKRLKLKYARLITCFSMLACLYHKGITPDYVINCIKMTPFERLDRLASENATLNDIVTSIKKEYEWFLNLRQNYDNSFDEENIRILAFDRAENFHDLVVHKLMSEVSKNYPQLRKRVDIY